MNQPQGGPNYDPRTLQLIYFALLGSQVFFLFLVLFTTENPSFFYNMSDFLYTLIPIVALVLDVVASRMFNKGIQNLTTTDLQTSFQRLTSLHIIRWAMVEGASFLLLVFAMSTENHFFTAFAVVNIIFFATLRPRLFTFNEGF
jgi:hypothetical protein